MSNFKQLMELLQASSTIQKNLPPFTLNIHDIVKQTNIKYYIHEFHRLVYRPHMINNFYLKVDHPKYDEINVIDNCNHLNLYYSKDRYPWRQCITIDLNKSDWIDRVNEIYTYNNDADFI